MASSYYDSAGKEVYDGNIAYADDVNTINEAVNTAFEVVEAEIAQVNDDADQWATEAQAWAENPEDAEVEVGKYSALHHAAKALASATAASGSASTASGAASTATTQAGLATTAKNNAVTAQTNAETAETNAETAETNAVTAKNAAETAQGLAETAQGLAETAETNAGASEDMAQEWAEKAEDSAITDNPGSYSSYHWAQKSQGFALNSPYPLDTLQAKGSVSGAVACDASLYDTFTMTITGATTLSYSNLATGRTFSLVITNGGTSVTFPAGTVWPGGEVPELTASGTDRVVVQEVSSGVYQTSLAGVAYA